MFVQTFDGTGADFLNDVLWLLCSRVLTANEDSLLRLIIYDNAAHLMHRHNVLIKSNVAPFISTPPAAPCAMEHFHHNEPGAQRGKDSPPERAREGERAGEWGRKGGGSSNQAGRPFVTSSL